jgi:hypothetical protein
MGTDQTMVFRHLNKTLLLYHWDFSDPSQIDYTDSNNLVLELGSDTTSFLHAFDQAIYYTIKNPNLEMYYTLDMDSAKAEMLPCYMCYTWAVDTDNHHDMTQMAVQVSVSALEPVLAGAQALVEVALGVPL